MLNIIITWFIYKYIS